MEKMAANGRRANRSVTEEMYADGYRFEFYQAVRLFEILRANTSNPIGEGIDPSQEATRFRSKISMEFPPTDIDGIRPVEEGERCAEITVNFMGLAGHFGPLPPTYTEFITERTRKRDYAMREFLDVFNHRLISIFYRIRKRRRVAFDVKRPEHSQFARYLFSIFGLGMQELRGRLGIDDRFLLGYAGLLAQKPRSAIGLRTILKNFLGLEAEVKSFGGAWLHLVEDQVTKLGTRGANNALGNTAIIGAKVWDQHANIEVGFSGLKYDQFQRLLPTGNEYLKLISLIEFYVDKEVGFNITLELNGADAPRLELGGKCRLGWTTRLGSNEEAGGDVLRISASPSNFIAVIKNVAGAKDAEFEAAAAALPSSLFNAN